MYTNQQIFDIVWDTFIVKKASKSSNPNSMRCYYTKSINGFGCGVGCCLPDGVGDIWDTFSAGTISDIYDKHLEEYSEYFLTENLTLLEAIQNWHDDELGYTDDKYYLQQIAVDFELKVPIETI